MMRTGLERHASRLIGSYNRARLLRDFNVSAVILATWLLFGLNVGRLIPALVTTVEMFRRIGSIC